MHEMKLGGQISFLRRNKGLTQEELAVKLGVTNQAVSKWESGQCCPDIAILPEIARIFAVSTDELLGYKADETPNNFILDLRGKIESLPKGEDYSYALRVVYALHAIIISKGMTDPATGNPGWDTDDAVEHAGNGECGYSCVNLPEITTVMRMDSVFWSSNRNVKINNSRLRDIVGVMRIFGDLRNLKFFSALYELTVRDEGEYVSRAEISLKSGLSDADVSSCADGELYAYLSEKNATAKRFTGSRVCICN